MESVFRFLINPREEGVFEAVYQLNLTNFINFSNYVNERRDQLRKHPSDDILDRIFEKEEHIETRFDDYFRRFLSLYIQIESKSEINNYFQFSDDDLKNIIENEDRNMPLFYRLRSLFKGPFSPKIYENDDDAIYIKHKIIKKSKTMIIELISLKESSIKKFIDFYTCLPKMEDSLIKLSYRKSYSEKYIFKLYPYILKLFLLKDIKFKVQTNIYEFLEAAINYYFRNEWRTSIILSSITVESILAELYEEKYKKNPPDAPLGPLKIEVEKKISFPYDISDKLNDLNKCRIASVHRTENPVSDKDAIIAMIGVTNLVIWYFNTF